MENDFIFLLRPTVLGRLILTVLFVAFSIILLIPFYDLGFVGGLIAANYFLICESFVVLFVLSVQKG